MTNARVWQNRTPNIVGYPIGWYVDFEGRASLGPFDCETEAERALSETLERYGEDRSAIFALQQDALNVLLAQAGKTREAYDYYILDKDRQTWLQRLSSWFTNAARRLLNNAEIR